METSWTSWMSIKRCLLISRHDLETACIQRWKCLAITNPSLLWQDRRLQNVVAGNIELLWAGADNWVSWLKESQNTWDSYISSLFLYPWPWCVRDRIEWCDVWIVYSEWYEVNCWHVRVFLPLHQLSRSWLARCPLHVHLSYSNVAAELSFPSVMQCFSDNQWHGSGFTGVAHPPMQPCGSALGLRDMASPTLRFITWKEVIQVPVIEVKNIRSDQIVMELIISAFILPLPLTWIYLPFYFNLMADGEQRGCQCNKL